MRRLLDLGATRVDNWPYPEHADFVVLRDPDGNEFCVIDHVELERTVARAYCPAWANRS